MDDEYAEVPCPLPGCEAGLHLQRTTSRWFFAGDFLDAGICGEDGDVASWQVECREGHVLLLPGDVGCPQCEDDAPSPCPHEGTFDGSDDYRTFQLHDLGRLRVLLDQMSATKPVKN